MDMPVDIVMPAVDVGVMLGMDMSVGIAMEAEALMSIFPGILD